jgi:UDP-glucuronate 4-epimerase
MKKVVVTGAAGFIGSHLARSLLLDPKVEVVGIDNLKPAYGGEWGQKRLRHLMQFPNFFFLEIDLVRSTPEELKKVILGAHSVIHLAAWPGVRFSQECPLEYSRANITGFTNILEAVRLAKPRQFLFASSSSVYGDLGVNGAVKESDATGNNLKSYYASTKWANEILAKAYTNLSKVPTMGLRFFTVYGEAGRPDMAYWGFLEKIISDEPINLYGAKGGSRNFTYIKDCVEILLRLIECDFNDFSTVNVAAGGPIDTIDFIRPVYDLVGHELKLNIVDRPSVDVEKTWADLSKLNELIGPIEPTPPSVGLYNFYNWYQKDKYQ